MKKPAVIKPWEIAFLVIYRGRHSLFQYRDLVRTTLDNIAHLQDCVLYAPDVPCILAESAGEDVRAGKEVWVEDLLFHSGENPPMPRYMFARLIASVFGQYVENRRTPFCICQRGLAETNTLSECILPSEDYI